MGEVMTVQDYPFAPGLPGQVEEWPDGRKFVYAYFDDGVLSPGSVVQGGVLMLSYDTGTTMYNPLVIAVGTSAVYRLPVVAMYAIAVAGWHWFQFAGDAQVLCDGTPTDIALGDFLECLNTTDSLIVDHATVRSVYSIAVAKEAYTTNAEAVKNVWLIGDRVNIAAA